VGLICRPLGGRPFAGARRLMLWCGSALVISCAAMVATAGVASAVTHPYVGVFATVANPQALAVDQANGDVYVIDVGTQSVLRYDPSGNPADFSALGTNVLDGAGGGSCPSTPADCDETPQNGFAFDAPSAAQIAVDNSGGVTDGDVYVTNSLNGVVDVFASTGAYVGQIDGTGATPPSGGEVCGVAVDASGNVYAGYYNGNVDKYTPVDGVPTNDVFDGQLLAGAGICNIAADSTGAVYASQWPSGPLTKYDASQFGAGTPSGTVIDGTSKAVAVDAATGDIYVDEGLRIVQYAADGSVLGQSGSPTTLSLASYGVALRSTTGDLYVSDAGHGYIAHFGPAVAAPPVITFETVQDVGSRHATLVAGVNPEGPAGTYRFEYGPQDCATSTCTSIPAPDAALAGGLSDTTVSQLVEGLQPDTTYHYRFVAGNAANGTAQGPDRTFRTLGVEAPALPDRRAWELVSPPEKNGGDIAAAPSRTRVAADGDAVQFLSSAGFGDVHGTDAIATEYVATRNASGWATHGITPPQDPPPLPTWSSRYAGDFSPDLSTGIYYALSPVGDSDPNVAQLRNLYLRRDLLTAGPGTYQLLSGCPACASPLAPLPFRTEVNDPALAGASADFRHVMFESPLDLTADASGSGLKLYEAVDGHVRLAGILPDGACAPSLPPCPAAESVAGQGASMIGDLDNGQFTSNTISADGSRIIFTAGPFSQPADLGVQGVLGRGGDLYLRENGTTTVQLNVSERTTADSGGHKPALFGGASKDGSKVFFISGEALTDDAPLGEISLYRYDLSAPAGHHLTLVTKDEQPADDGSGTPKASYVAGVSDDGSYVYFWGANALASGQPPNDAGNGVKLLYVWHDGTIHLVGTDVSGLTSANWGEEGPLSGLIDDEFRVTPDGRHAAFATRNSATADSVGYDNRCIGGGFCKEVYLYSADANRLVCASCDPSGAEPVGDAELMGNSNDTTNLTTTQHLNHVLSDDGRRVFFDTPDPLVSGDANGKRDVYEYDATTGGVGLLSSGRGNGDSFLVEATPSGNDVFFTTRERLVGIDTDGNTDLYDARVDGGIAAQNPPSAVPCDGESCHGSLPAPAPPPVVASMAFVSQGAASHAVRGRVRLIRKEVHGARFTFLVKVPGPGRISGRGAEVHTVVRSVPRAGTYRLRFVLTAHARRILRHRHRLRLRVRVEYRTAGGVVTSLSAMVVVKGKVRR
jgi:hypothetical protein